MIVWPEHLVLSSESPWSVLHKLAWFNETTPSEFLATFYGVQARGGLDLRDPQWLASARWCGKENEPCLDGQFLSTVLAARTPGLLLGKQIETTSVLRTCSRCMNFGYHSLLHQLPMLDLCPSHREQLKTGCPSCGAIVAYAVFPKGPPFGCHKCRRARCFPNHWSPSMNVYFEHYESSGVGRIRTWCSEVGDMPIHVTQKFFLASDGVTDCTITRAGVRCWLANRFTSSRWAQELFWPEPAHCTPHVYDSIQGELLRISPTTSRSRQIEFALELQEQVEEIARSFVQRFDRLHPCLGLAHQEMWISPRTGGNYVSAKRTLCCVAMGYYVWIRTAMQLVEEIGAINREATLGYVEGNLSDLRRGLKTELHHSIYVVYRVDPARAKCDRARRAEILESRKVRRLYLEWCGNGILEISKLRQHVRPDLDYSEFVQSLPCKALESRGRVRARAAQG